MTEKTKTPLEPCPFCGSENLAIERSLGPPKEFYVLCECGASASHPQDWNRRASQARQRELEEALREWVALKNLLGADSYDGIEPRYVAMLDDLANRSALLNSPAGEQTEGWVLVPREPGSCEGDDSGWVLAFLRTLHAHLPEDEQPSAWMQFSDDQRERIKAGYRAMIAAVPAATGGNT